MKTANDAAAFLRGRPSQRRRYADALIGVLVELCRWDQRDRLPAEAAARLAPPDMPRHELMRRRSALDDALRQLDAA